MVQNRRPARAGKPAPPPPPPPKVFETSGFDMRPPRDLGDPVLKPSTGGIGRMIFAGLITAGLITAAIVIVLSISHLTSEIVRIEHQQTVLSTALKGLEDETLTNAFRIEDLAEVTRSLQAAIERGVENDEALADAIATVAAGEE